MKENKVSIQINRPASEVFDFTINPANTSKWIESIEKEETNEWPVKIGSVYRNVDAVGKWDEYTLAGLEKNKLFELASREGGYHVQYTYTSIPIPRFQTRSRCLNILNGWTKVSWRIPSLKKY